MILKKYFNFIITYTFIIISLTIPILQIAVKYVNKIWKAAG